MKSLSLCLMAFALLTLAGCDSNVREDDQLGGMIGSPLRPGAPSILYIQTFTPGGLLPASSAETSMSKLDAALSARLADIAPTQVIPNSSASSGWLLTGRLIDATPGQLAAQVTVFNLAKSSTVPSMTFSASIAGVPPTTPPSEDWDVLAQQIAIQLEKRL